MGAVAGLNRLSELGIIVRTDGQKDYSSACPEYGIGPRAWPFWVRATSGSKSPPG